MHSISIFKQIPKRYIVTFLAFVGNFLVTYLKLNLSIAIPEMTSNKTIIRGNETEIIKAEFSWTSVQIGYILSAFSFGSVFAVLGGLIVPKIGGVIIVGVGVTISAIITLITPFVIRRSFVLFIILRAVLGCIEGLAGISLMDVFTHWSPPSERARLVALAYSGGIWSIAVNFPLSGVIIHCFNWETLFYISGSITLIWCVTWIILVSNNPSTDRFITEKERLFLVREIKHISNESGKKVNIPWKMICTSVPVYAILNEMFVASFTASFLGTCLPLYIEDVFHVDIQTIGFISGLPILCGTIAVPIAGFFADYLRSNVFDVTKVNKLYIFWGEIGTLISLFIAAIWGNVYGCILCICFVTISYSFADSSYQVICMDIAGQYAGTLKALTCITASIAHFINPVVIGYLTPDHSQSEWNVYFGFLSIMTVYGVIMFTIFGSSDLQPWARPQEEKQISSINEDKGYEKQEKFHNQNNYITHM